MVFIFYSFMPEISVQGDLLGSGSESDDRRSCVEVYFREPGRAKNIIAKLN
jgi:hypothetical protein